MTRSADIDSKTQNKNTHLTPSILHTYPFYLTLFPFFVEKRRELKDMATGAEKNYGDVNNNNG